MTSPAPDAVTRPPAVARRAELLLGRLDHVVPADGDGLQKLSEERGWAEAVRFFAANGALTTGGLTAAEERLAEIEGWVAGQDNDLDPPALPPVPDGDRGLFEAHAEPVVLMQSLFMANAWYRVSPQPDGTVGIGYGAWCQGIGTLRHEEWTAHPDRETAIRHFVTDVRELLLSGKKLEPVQEKARDGLLVEVESLVTRLF